MKTERKNMKSIKRIISLAIALVMTVAALSAFAFSSSAETGAPDVSSGATQDPNGAADGGLTFGDPASGGQNGAPGQNTDGNGNFQAPPNGGNGNAPGFPELPDQNGGNGQSGNDADGNRQFPQFQQPPTDDFGNFNGSVDFGRGDGGFNYSEATFWLLVGITGIALISLCAVGLTKLLKRSKKEKPASQPVNEPARPAPATEQE